VLISVRLQEERGCETEPDEDGCRCRLGERM
jgi:hypothetical protein